VSRPLGFGPPATVNALADWDLPEDGPFLDETALLAWQVAAKLLAPLKPLPLDVLKLAAFLLPVPVELDEDEGEDTAPGGAADTERAEPVTVGEDEEGFNAVKARHGRS